MAKNIMISNEIYERLLAIKRKDESFSELLLRLLKYQKMSVLDLAGEWPFSKEVTSELEKHLEDSWRE